MVVACIHRAVALLPMLHVQPTTLYGRKTFSSGKYSGPNDEIGQLVETFNEMLDRLQSLFEGQRRFLAEAAHELRTPLAAMTGNIDLLARFHEDHERRVQAIAALQRTGKHVSRLLDDLLLLAQADAGWRSHLEPMWFDDLFMEVYESSRCSFEHISQIRIDCL